jgi:hypothetical protein
MPLSVAIVAGTGSLGLGLALRWAQAGEKVLLGSRTLDKARSAADQVRRVVPACDVEALLYADAVQQAPVVVLALPLAARIPTLKLLKDHWQANAVLVETAVPLERAVGGRLSHILPLWEGSAAEQSARYVPDTVRVTAALHSVSAKSLQNLEQPLKSDVLVVGNDREARRITADLIGKIPGARTIDAGPLENARYAEHLAALLIALNLRHEVDSSGIRFTGLPGLEDDA